MAFLASDGWSKSAPLKSLPGARHIHQGNRLKRDEYCWAKTARQERQEERKQVKEV
jgi:hypothetical protein